MWFLFALYMMLTARLAGNGFGSKWGLSWLPEVWFTMPFGLALGWALPQGWIAFTGSIVGWVISYAFMQSATWMFLRWQSHDDPNVFRNATLRPIMDWIAARFGWKLGDEGYAWVAASVKGFFIGLPVGGLPLAILWPLAYEIGSHTEGRVEKYGIDPHSVRELLSGLAASVSIMIFVFVIQELR